MQELGRRIVSGGRRRGLRIEPRPIRNRQSEIRDSKTLRLARDLHRHVAVGCRAVAELSVEVPTPAVRDAGDRDGAGMPVPGAQARERDPARDGHGPGAARDGPRIALLRSSVAPSAELAETVSPPAIRRPGYRDTAGITGTGAHRGEREPTGHGHGDQTPVVGRAVPELAVNVQPPAVRRPASGET